VRACLVPRACDHEWSSYRINAGLRPDAMIEPHPEYIALGVNQALEPSMVTANRKATDAGYPLGSEPGL
jgi:hypothetical protein